MRPLLLQVSKEAYAGIVCHLAHGLGGWLGVSSIWAHLASQRWAFWWVSATFSPDGMNVCGGISEKAWEGEYKYPVQSGASVSSHTDPSTLIPLSESCGSSSEDTEPAAALRWRSSTKSPLPDFPCSPCFNGEGSDKAVPGGFPSLCWNPSGPRVLPLLPSSTKLLVECQPLSWLAGLGRTAQA